MDAEAKRTRMYSQHIVEQASGFFFHSPVLTAYIRSIQLHRDKLKLAGNQVEYCFIRTRKHTSPDSAATSKLRILLNQ